MIFLILVVSVEVAQLVDELIQSIQDGITHVWHLGGVEFVFHYDGGFKTQLQFFDTPPIKMFSLYPFIYVPLLNVGRSDTM